MTKADAWSVQGLGAQTRQAAEEAARRAGMSVGDWLDRIIAAGSTPEGSVEPKQNAPREADEPPGSNLTRLPGPADMGDSRNKRQREWRHLRARSESLRDTLSRRAAPPAPTVPREPTFETPPTAPRVEDDTIEMRLQLARDVINRAAEGRRRNAEPPQQSSDSRLEASIDAIQRKVSAQDEQTAAALANLKRQIETSEAMRAGERHALATIADRLVELEEHIAKRSEDAAYEPIRAALSKLEARIDGLAQRTEDVGARDTVDDRLKELGDGLTGLTDKIAKLESTGSNSERAEHFARLESKLATILASLDRPRQEMAKPAPAPAAAAPLSSIDIAVAEIAKRQRALDEAGAALSKRRPQATVRHERPPAPEAVPTLDFRAFDKRLEAIADRIERAADIAGAKSAAPAPVDASAFETLRNEIARLGSRLDENRRREPHPEIQSLREEIGELSRALAGLASRDSVASLESAVRSLAARIENSREEGVGENLLAPIEHLAADLHSTLAQIDPRKTVEALDREIKAVAAKLDQMAVRDFDPDAFARIHDQTQEIRDLLKAAALRPMPIERMERQITLLTSRLDEVVAQNAFQPGAQALAASEPIAALEARVEALAGKIEEALTRPAPETAAFGELNQRLDSVQSALQQQSGRAADTRQLETMILRLAETVESARQPGADAAALEALEAQISQIATRLDRSDKNIAAIGSLEQAIGELFGRLEEGRQAAIVAAETAAHTAAKEALRQAMASSAGQTAPQVEQIGREIVDLRSTQDEADRRIHATLSAVHETLEKVVDRLAGLERQPTPDAQRSVRPSPAAVAAPAQAASSAESTSGARAALDFVLGRREGAAETRRQPLQAPAKAERPAPPTPSVDAPDFLIEPGSGIAPRRAETNGRGRIPAQTAPAQPATSETEREASAQSSFIAAARRAAQAAAAEAAAASASRVKGTMQRSGKAASGDGKAGVGAAEQVRAFVASRKRPILLGVAGLVILFGAYAVMRTINNPHDLDKPAAPATTGDNQSAPPAEAPKRSPQAALEPTDGVLAEAPGAPVAAPAPALPSMASNGQGFDMTPSGSIGPGTATFTSNRNAAAAGPAAQTASLPTGAPATSVVLPLRDAALSGNAAAQYELGIRLAEGKSMARDPKAAAEWFSRAAGQGLAPAEFRLGVVYEKGLGFAQDLPLAKAWYERAALAGHAHAMHNLAVVLAEGAGGKPDYPEAARWFHKAAEFGIRDSQYNLAILYARGLGIEQDFTQSYVWFSLAAAQGDEDAAKKRDEVAKRLDADALATAKTQIDAFHAKQPDRAANEVDPPPGGWDPPAKPASRSPAAARPKVSSL